MIATSSDLAFVAHAPGFAGVTGEEPLLRLLAEVDAHEGPVYFADENALCFTTLPRTGVDGSPSVQIKRLPLDDPEAISVLVADANGANGMASDRDGRLIVCEQGGRWEPARISRVDRATGERERVVEDWCGLRFNSPNDVVVASDGAIWFTDPSTSARCTSPTAAPTRSRAVTTSIGPDHVKAFDVTGGTRLSGERLFAVVTPGFPDGLKVDRDGRVYASCFSGVQIFDPHGELLGEIRLAGVVNFCFGGPGRDLLLITTDSAVWAVALAAKGA